MFFIALDFVLTCILGPHYAITSGPMSPIWMPQHQDAEVVNQPSDEQCPKGNEHQVEIDWKVL